MTDEIRGNVYKVGQINSYIKNMFDQDFMLKHIYVSGEVSNCRYHSSGHIYFTLKDDSGVLGAVMFAGSRKKGLTFPMKDGDEVIVLGRISVYERNGAYQLYAQQILAQGEGEINRQYEALRERLSEMGMFSAEYKREIPAYASRIGVVTSSTGDVIFDIRNVAHRRNPCVQILLYPAQVQGDGAAKSMAEGIRTLEEHGVDVIIIGRGGGSTENLWAFNEEELAWAIFECTVPVISAVGHDPNSTITDSVADVYVPTPSAAAELAVFELDRALAQIGSFSHQLNREIGTRLDRTEARIRQYRTELEVKSPANRLLQDRHRAAEEQERLQNRMEQILREMLHRLQLAAGELEARSPLKKLEGGYAFLTTPDGHRIFGVEGLGEGDRFLAYLRDGSITASVEKVRPGNRSGGTGGEETAAG